MTTRGWLGKNREREREILRKSFFVFLLLNLGP